MFEKEKEYFGFKFVRAIEMKEVKATLYELEHIVTGMPTYYMKSNNGDDKKGFNMAFLTPPLDNTGIPHIIEHSILAGSKEYTKEEAFYRAASRSLALDLNAYTADDYTMYYFLTKDEKDFDKLLKMYLDGIFDPNFKERDDLVLYKEGGRPEEDNEKIIYNGIVYNEMKYYETDIDLLEFEIAKREMFNDTYLIFDSGGKMSEIPYLKREKLIEFYDTFYHPSNAALMIYGDVDIFKYLEFLNNKYLSRYERKIYDGLEELVSKNTGAFVKTTTKPITSNFILNEDADRTMLFSNNKPLSLSDEILIEILLSYIYESNDLSIYDIMEENVADCVHCTLENSFAGDYWGFNFKNVTNFGDDAITFLDELLQGILERGFDTSTLKIICDKYRDGYLNESDMFGESHKIISCKVLKRNYFEKSYTEIFDFLDDKIKNDVNYFCDAIKKFFLNAKNIMHVIYMPSKNYIEEIEKITKYPYTDLKKFHPRVYDITKESLGLLDGELKKSIFEKDLTNTSYGLDVFDAFETNKWCKTKTFQIADKTVNGYVFEKREDVWISLRFDISNLDVNETTILRAIYNYLFIDENFYDEGGLEKEVLKTFKYYDTSFIFNDDLKDNKTKRFFVLNVLLSFENLKKGMELIKKGLTKKIEDKKLIYSLLCWYTKSIVELNEENIYKCVMNESRAPFSKASYLNELTSGLNAGSYIFKKYIYPMEEQSDKYEYDKIRKTISNICKKVFNMQRLKFYFAAKEDILDSAFKIIDDSLKDFPKEEFGYEDINEEGVALPLKTNKNQAYIVPSLLQYNALSVDLCDMPEELTNYMDVFCNYINEEFLEKKIREYYSAYGVGSSFKEGVLTLVSYRDSKFEETLDSFLEIFEEISKCEVKNLEDHKIKVLRMSNEYYDELDKVMMQNKIIESDTKKTFEEILLEKKEKVLKMEENDVLKIATFVNDAIKNKKYSLFTAGNYATILNVKDAGKDIIFTYKDERIKNNKKIIPKK